MTKRTPIIAGNWKMNLNYTESVHLVQGLYWQLRDAAYDYNEGEVLVIPPFVDIRSVQVLVESDELPIKYGAQDISTHDKGAYTGEVAGSMIKALGATYVLVGHSERRQYHAEDCPDILIAKIQQALKNELTPIFCVGENLEIREAGTYKEHILKQVADVLHVFSGAEIASFVIAYEPIWAIGTGKTATAADAQEIAFEIRKLIREKSGDDVADKVRIQYGGSAKSSNAADIMAGADVDGLLVGGAALEAEEFSKIVRISAKA
jgi:triosephosphate isomerase